MCLGYVHTHGHKWVRAHSLALISAGPCRASAWAAASPCGSEWTGPWDQISELCLLTCVLLRKTLARRLGSDLNLCLNGFLPPLPDSWVELWPQPPSRLLSVSAFPTLNPFTALQPMWSGPQHVFRGPSPQATFSVSDPGPVFVSVLFQRGEKGSWFQ